MSEVTEDPDRTPTPSLLRNFVSFIGIIIAAAAITSFVLLFLLEMTGHNENPYSVLVTYIFVPSILVFGLAVMLLGALIERRRRLSRAPGDLSKYPVLDLNDPRRRRSRNRGRYGFRFACSPIRIYSRARARDTRRRSSTGGSTLLRRNRQVGSPPAAADRFELSQP